MLGAMRACIPLAAFSNYGDEVEKKAGAAKRAIRCQRVVAELKITGVTGLQRSRIERGCTAARSVLFHSPGHHCLPRQSPRQKVCLRSLGCMV